MTKTLEEVQSKLMSIAGLLDLAKTLDDGAYFELFSEASTNLWDISGMKLFDFPDNWEQIATGLEADKVYIPAIKTTLVNKGAKSADSHQ